MIYLVYENVPAYRRPLDDASWEPFVTSKSVRYTENDRLPWVKGCFPPKPRSLSEFYLFDLPIVAGLHWLLAVDVEFVTTTPDETEALVYDPNDFSPRIVKRNTLNPAVQAKLSGQP